MKRPIGITILAVLALIVGGGVLGIQLYFSPALIESFSRTGISGIYLQLSIALLACWAVIGSGGMLWGKQWGWWLGTLYVICGVIRAVYALLYAIPSLINSYELYRNGSVFRYYAQPAILLGIHVAIVAYLLTKRVAEYFGVAGMGNLKKISLLGGIALVLCFGLLLSQYLLRVNVPETLIGPDCDNVSYINEPERKIVVEVANSADIHAIEQILTARFSAFLPSSCARLTSQIDGSTIEFLFRKGAPEEGVVRYLVEHQGLFRAMSEDDVQWFTEHDIAEVSMRKVDEKFWLTVTFSEKKAKEIHQLSSQSIGKLVTISFDNEPLLRASVREPLSENMMIPLASEYSPYLQALETILEFGALPSSVEVIESDMN